MYNHLSSVINFFQDILCIFMSRDNTRNNHVNCERKTNYIFNMIWNNTDIKHDTCCSNNLLTQHKTGLLSCLICTVRTALFTPVGSSEPWTVLLEETWTTLLTTMFTGCSTALFIPVDNLCVFTCVYTAYID